MKILIVSSGYLPIPSIRGGAVETLIEHIISKNEINKDFEIDLFVVNDGKSFVNNNSFVNYYYINNVSFVYKIKRAFFAIINKLPNVYIGNAYINSVCSKIKRLDKQYDVCIIENNPLYILKLKKYLNSKFYLHLHNDYLNVNSKKNIIVKSLYDKIITVSNFLKNNVLQIQGDTPVSVVYNGVDVDKFATELPLEEKNILRSNYCDTNDILFLYVGRIIPIKGVYELVLAFNRLCEKYSNIKLLIVGSPDSKSKKNLEYNRKVIDISSKNRNISFSGFVPYSKLYAYYKISDIQIVPSIGPEAFGNVVVEGMAAGLPLIVSSIGGIPEIVNEDCALLCNPDNIVDDLENNMEKLICNKYLIEKFKSEGNDIYKKFSVDNYYSNFVSEIKKDM